MRSKSPHKKTGQWRQKCCQQPSPWGSKSANAILITDRKVRQGRTPYHIPASNCTNPPYPKAAPTTRLGVVTPLVCMLINPRTNVVRAKPQSPNGAGFAILRSWTWRYSPGWNSPPKAGRRSCWLLTCARGPYPKRAAALAVSCSSWVIWRCKPPLPPWPGISFSFPVPLGALPV